MVPVRLLPVQPDWRKGNLFVVLTRARHEHASADEAEAILFSVRDTPVMQALESLTVDHAVAPPSKAR